jgi:hypothetical protein
MVCFLSPRLVRAEGVLVVLPQTRILIFLEQDAIADRQHLDVSAPEAAECASSGVRTIGSPRTLKLVFTMTVKTQTPRQVRILAKL